MKKIVIITRHNVSQLLEFCKDYFGADNLIQIIDRQIDLSNPDDLILIESANVILATMPIELQIDILNKTKFAGQLLVPTFTRTETTEETEFSSGGKNYIFILSGVKRINEIIIKSEIIYKSEWTK